MNLAHEIPKPPKTHSTPHAPKKKQVEKRSSWRKHPKIKIKLLKSTARHQQMVAANSSSSEEDVSLGVDHGKASAPTCYGSSFRAVSQRRGGVPSQRSQFTRKY